MAGSIRKHSHKTGTWPKYSTTNTPEQTKTRPLPSGRKIWASVTVQGGSGRLKIGLKRRKGGRLSVCGL